MGNMVGKGINETVSHPTPPSEASSPPYLLPTSVSSWPSHGPRMALAWPSHGPRNDGTCIALACHSHCTRMPLACPLACPSHAPSHAPRMPPRMPLACPLHATRMPLVCTPIHLHKKFSIDRILHVLASSAGISIRSRATVYHEGQLPVHYPVPILNLIMFSWNAL